VLNGALFESGRPVLLLPKARQFPEASNGDDRLGRERRGLEGGADAIELMQQAEEVHAVLIDPVPSFEGHGPEPGMPTSPPIWRATASPLWCTGCRRRARRSRHPQADGGDLGADLIVMGGFGHSRLRQRIFGGTTTKMIEQGSGAGADGALRPQTRPPASGAGRRRFDSMETAQAACNAGTRAWIGRASSMPTIIATKKITPERPP
jgi:nucleotide-binding universal stress UspA family protein